MRSARRREWRVPIWLSAFFPALADRPTPTGRRGSKHRTPRSLPSHDVDASGRRMASVTASGSGTGLVMNIRKWQVRRSNPLRTRPRPISPSLSPDAHLGSTKHTTKRRRWGCGRGTPGTRTTSAASAASHSTHVRRTPSSRATIHRWCGDNAGTRSTSSASPDGSTRRRSSGAQSAAARGSSSSSPRRRHPRRYSTKDDDQVTYCGHLLATRHARSFTRTLVLI